MDPTLDPTDELFGAFTGNPAGTPSSSSSGGINWGGIANGVGQIAGTALAGGFGSTAPSGGLTYTAPPSVSFTNANPSGAPIISDPAVGQAAVTNYNNSAYGSIARQGFLNSTDPSVKMAFGADGSLDSGARLAALNQLGIQNDMSGFQGYQQNLQNIISDGSGSSSSVANAGQNLQSNLTGNLNTIANSNSTINQANNTAQGGGLAGAFSTLAGQGWTGGA